MPAVAPRPPGEILEEKIKDKNLTQAQAADLIGITRQYLNGIINGKYPFTADLSLKLKEPLGTAPEFWTEAIRSYEEFLGTDTGREIQRAKDRESLLLDFELQTVRTLVDHQIESAVKASYLGIDPFQKDRFQGSCYQLSVGLKGYLYDTDGKSTPAASKPSVTLARGETLAISTLEKISVPGRLRASIAGLCDALAEKCLLLSCSRVLPENFSNHITFSLTNLGPFNVTLSHGDPCLVIGFEFLAQQPLRATDS